MSRTCPVCGKDRVCSVYEAKEVFQTRTWGNDALLDEAERVCSFCRAVKIGGQWCDRLQSVNERAWQLASAGSKDQEEYVEILGELPGDKPAATDGRRANPDDSDFDW